MRTKALLAGAPPGPQTGPWVPVGLQEVWRFVPPPWLSGKAYVELCGDTPDHNSRCEVDGQDLELSNAVAVRLVVLNDLDLNERITLVIEEVLHGNDIE